LNGRVSVIEGLVRDFEGLLEVLELAIRDLAEVRDSLKDLLGKLKPKVDAKAVLEMLPGKLRREVSVSDGGDYITVKTKRFLSSEDFKALAEAIISRLGGEYVSTTSKGGGYFRIPKYHAENRLRLS